MSESVVQAALREAYCKGIEPQPVLILEVLGVNLEQLRLLTKERC